MTTQTTQLSEFKALKADLNCAWESRNYIVVNDEIVEDTNTMNCLMNARSYIDAVDPESMIMLKALFSVYGKGSDSLNSFARKVRTVK